MTRHEGGIHGNEGDAGRIEVEDCHSIIVHLSTPTLHSVRSSTKYETLTRERRNSDLLGRGDRQGGHEGREPPRLTRPRPLLLIGRVRRGRGRKTQGHVTQPPQLTRAHLFPSDRCPCPRVYAPARVGRGPCLGANVSPADAGTGLLRGGSGVPWHILTLFDTKWHFYDLYDTRLTRRNAASPVATSCKRACNVRPPCGIDGAWHNPLPAASPTPIPPSPACLP